MAGQRCPLCSEPIKPGEPVSFHDGELVHMPCYVQQSQATPRRTDTSYKGHAIRVFCYPLLGRWRASVLVDTPGRVRSINLGRINLCNTAQGALAFALKAATDWIDNNAAKAAHGPMRDKLQ